jgi:hypothetical protein
MVIYAMSKSGDSNERSNLSCGFVRPSAITRRAPSLPKPDYYLGPGALSFELREKEAIKVAMPCGCSRGFGSATRRNEGGGLAP